MGQGLRCINASHLYFLPTVLLSSAAVSCRTVGLNYEDKPEVNKREYKLYFFISNTTLVDISHA